MITIEEHLDVLIKVRAKVLLHNKQNDFCILMTFLEDSELLFVILLRPISSVTLELLSLTGWPALWSFFLVSVTFSKSPTFVSTDPNDRIRKRKIYVTSTQLVHRLQWMT